MTTEPKVQLEVAAQWLSEGAIALERFNPETAKQLRRVSRECLKVAKSKLPVPSGDQAA